MLQPGAKVSLMLKWEQVCGVQCIDTNYMLVKVLHPHTQKFLVRALVQHKELSDLVHDGSSKESRQINSKCMHNSLVVVLFAFIFTFLRNCCYLCSGCSQCSHSSGGAELDQQWGHLQLSCLICDKVSRDVHLLASENDIQVGWGLWALEGAFHCACQPSISVSALGIHCLLSTWDIGPRLDIDKWVSCLRDACATIPCFFCLLDLFANCLRHM